MKLTKFRITVLILLAASAVYPAVVIWSFNEYDAFVARTLAPYQDDPDMLPWICTRPYSDFWCGKVAVWTGIALMLCWILSVCLTLSPLSLLSPREET